MMLLTAIALAAQASAPPPRVFAPPAPPLPSLAYSAPVRLDTEIPLIGEDDYPAQAMFDDAEGVTALVLAIGANGRAKACDVTTSSGHPQLDIRACALVRQRARFRPAQLDGRAIESQWRGRIRWTLPNEGHVMVDPRANGKARTPPDPRPEFYDIDPRIAAWGAGARGPVHGRTFVLLDIDAAGAVIGCTLDGGDADAVRTEQACKLFGRKKLFVPGFDAESNAVHDRVRVKIGW